MQTDLLALLLKGCHISLTALPCRCHLPDIALQLSSGLVIDEVFVYIRVVPGNRSLLRRCGGLRFDSVQDSTKRISRMRAHAQAVTAFSCFLRAVT